MHYRVEAFVESPRSEEELGAYIEGLFGMAVKVHVEDLSVYEVTG